MQCFYNVKTLDGRCSAALIRLKYPDTTFIGVDYINKIQILNFLHPTSKIIWIVDYAFPLADMKSAVNQGYALKWIHHCHQYDFFGIESIDNIESSSCALTWQYLNPEIKSKNMPEVIKLIDDYTMGKYNKKAEAFQYGINFFSKTMPSDVIWRDMLQADHCGIPSLVDVIRQGCEIMNQIKYDSLFT